VNLAGWRWVRGGVALLVAATGVLAVAPAAQAAETPAAVRLARG
jgi:hypothetical protein